MDAGISIALAIHSFDGRDLEIAPTTADAGISIALAIHSFDPTGSELGLDFLFWRFPEQYPADGRIQNVCSPTSDHGMKFSALAQTFQRGKRKPPIQKTEKKGDNQSGKKSRFAKTDGDWRAD